MAELDRPAVAQESDALTLVDRGRIDALALRRLGARGTVNVGDNGLQVVVGPIATTPAKVDETRPAGVVRSRCGRRKARSRAPVACESARP